MKYYYLSITGSKEEIPFIESFQVNDNQEHLNNICNEKIDGEIIAKTNMIGKLQDFVFPIEDFIPMVSEEIKNIMLKYDNEIKTITISKVDIKENTIYYRIVINQIYDCIDWEKTSYLDIELKVQNKIMRTPVGQIYINNNEITNDIFLIKGWETYPIISERIKKEIEKYQVNGISFSEIICT